MEAKKEDLILGLPPTKFWEIFMHVTYITVLIGMIILLFFGWRVYSLIDGECSRLIEEEFERAEFLNYVPGATLNESLFNDSNFIVIEEETFK